MYCQVAGCRFPSFHSTSAHKCGNCDYFGHGVMECQDADKIRHLSSLEDRLIPIHSRCTISGCMYPETHTNGSHHCRYCMGKDHGEADCIIKEIVDYHGNYDNLEHDLQTYNNIYFIEYSGMGTRFYIRKKDWTIRFLIMTQDSWGQYGEDTSDLPRLNRFIDGLRELDSEEMSLLSQHDEWGDFVQPPSPTTVPTAVIDPSNPDEYPTLERLTETYLDDETYSPNEDSNDLPVPIVNMTGRELNEYYNNYLASFRNIETVKCPLCRTINDKSMVTKIKGLNVECSVCLSNNVSLYFPSCEHACVCQECFDQL